MAGQPIESILMRQLASYLAIPIFLSDNSGTLLYYNEAAESILGGPFAETEQMPAEVWNSRFSPMDEAGGPLPLEENPLMVAALRHRPDHSTMHVRGMDGVVRRIQVTGFPLIGIGMRQVGAVALFWETSR
jgi:PAS domain-containing protein